jgi:hypothetical protein
MSILIPDPTTILRLEIAGRFLRYAHRSTLSRCRGHSNFRSRREFDLDRHRCGYRSLVFLLFLAHRGN